MRKLFVIVSLLFCTYLAFSQDVITLKNGDKLKVKILQVDKKKVTYTKPEDTSGKIYTLNLSKVFIIIFEKQNEKYEHNPKAAEILNQ